MAGRKKDSVWLYFSEEATVSGKGAKAKCKVCGKEMMGLVARMKKHKETCCKSLDDEAEDTISSLVSENKKNTENSKFFINFI